MCSLLPCVKLFPNCVIKGDEKLNLSAFMMPSVLVLTAVEILRNGNSMNAFSKGAEDGIKSCVGLLPSLLMIMCSVNALFSSGLADLFCSMLSPILGVLKVPTAMIPSVVLRPFSGSAVTALADKLFATEGADSTTAKIACLLMGSTDTVLYTLGMYMSSAKIKKTRYAVPASLIVFVFSVFFCCILGSVLFY